MAFERIAAALNERQEQGYLRRRRTVEQDHQGIITLDGQHYLNFASNDYLGMRQDQQVLQAWVEGLAAFGGGSGASPLVTGHSLAHQRLEDYLATGLNREAAILFNSGFAANQALCHALFSEPGNVLCDKFMHASFLEGAMTSKARLRRFHHNDLGHLTQLLSKHREDDTLVATESVFSMDGDCSPLQDIANRCRQSQSWLMVDEAHAVGVSGETGLGLVEQMSLTQQDVAIVMGTFGKAVGTAGAFIAGSRELIDYLVNFARHYVYSTALTPAQAHATLVSLQLIAQGQMRSVLEENIEFFKREAAIKGFTLSPSDSAIQPLIIGNPAGALAFSEALKKRGVWVPAIRYPTVPRHTDRLRITLSSIHSKTDIQALVDALCLARDEVLAQ